MLATGLCVPWKGQRTPGLQPGHLYSLPDSPGAVSVEEALGAEAGAVLLGFVIEDSNISTVRFETWRPDVCGEGLVDSGVSKGASESFIR